MKMTNKDYKKFCERYDKFKNNNLPTPFWDEERLTQEYVYFYNGKSIFNDEEYKDHLEVSNSLTEALADITYTGFYYPFTDKHVTAYYKGNEFIEKVVIGHNHGHSFEEVVRALYDSPESFKITKDEEAFYSKQELEYLNRVQKYLLFIGIKDLEKHKAPVSRYRNKIHKKYENALINTFSNSLVKDVLSGKKDFCISKWYPDFSERVFKPGEYQCLVVDENNDFKLFIEFTKEEVKEFKEVKDQCKNSNYKDNDKVIVNHFIVLEKFDNNQ